MRTTTFIKSIILSLIAISAIVVKVAAQSPLTSPAHIGFVYPLSSNGKHAGDYTNHFSLHIIAGLSKAETGAAISGVSNIIRENASGAQVASFSNHMGSTKNAGTFAGVMNLVKRDASGIMVAGFMNRSASLEGVQVAGVINIVDKSAANSTQISGFLNKADSVNTSVAGFINLQKESKVQVAGFMNVSKNSNAQIAGFINVAKRVKGVQIAGFMNIADSSDFPIGLINIVKNGERMISVSIDETSTSILSFKSGGRTLYGILGIGYNFREDDAKYAIQGGIGAHLYLLSHFRINIEATNTVLTDFKNAHYNRATFGAYPAYRFGKRFEVFAGPTFNYLHTKDGVGQELASHYIWSDYHSKNRFNGAYFGGTAGVQVRL